MVVLIEVRRSTMTHLRLYGIGSLARELLFPPSLAGVELLILIGCMPFSECSSMFIIPPPQAGLSAEVSALQVAQEVRTRHGPLGR